MIGKNNVRCSYEKGRLLEMDGSVMGNLAGTGYFLGYQMMGLFLSFLIWKRENYVVRIMLGSVLGSVLLQWMPTLFSLGMGFNQASHIAALLCTFILLVGAYLFCWKRTNVPKEKVEEKRNWKECFFENGYLFIILPFFIFFLILLSSHTIPYGQDGSIHTGQATNGDMNMHLAFITSVAKQGVFPPEYSLLPGTKLSYPFLCDTISSSVYLWGSSLRLAYILPMLFAILQVMSGVMMLAKEVLKSNGKAVIAWLFFFLNGGLGVWYFLRGATEDSTVFTRIFTEFYQTPTNFLDGNIRWSNVIADMLLPQRATLFGWAVLMPSLFLLYRAIALKNRSYFVITAVLAGCLPMIHTHSFLALGLVCAMWLIYSMRTELNAEWKTKESKIELVVLFGFFLLMCVLDMVRRMKEVPSNLYLGIAFMGVAVIAALCLLFVIRGFREERSREMIMNWMIFLGIVLLLAIPQLFTWTFTQAQGEQFVRGHFNWANLNDTYLGFYAKNLGIVGFLSVVALIFTRSRNYFIVSPSFFIWFVAELVLFQPNEYDNNKLLYVGYLFLCLLSADYLVEIVKKFSFVAVKGAIYGGVMVLASISAILTLGREYVSDYQLYSADGVAMCKYLEEHTEPTDVILTDTRYNNEVVSLTGRNIVCGAASFLYYHGLDYQTQEADVALMYMNPQDSTLFDKYNVKYVYISDSERSKYSIVSEDAFLKNFEVMHQEGSVTLYRRSEGIDK